MSDMILNIFDDTDDYDAWADEDDGPMKKVDKKIIQLEATLTKKLGIKRNKVQKALDIICRGVGVDKLKKTLVGGKIKSAIGQYNEMKRKVLLRHKSSQIELNALNDINDRIHLLEKLIAKETVNIRGVGFYSLGTARKSLNDEQNNTYSILFERYFLKSFSSRLAEYSNPEIEVISQEKINDKYTIVSSILVATKERPEVKIDWRIYTKNPEKPLIRDLIIEGLSLARTQKEEFNSIIQSNDGDINALFASLKDFIKK